jgi:hypothetical protein
MKRCRTCGIDKPFREYYLQKGEPHVHCKACVGVRVRELRKKPIVRRAARKSAKASLLLPNRRGYFESSAALSRLLDLWR